LSMVDATGRSCEDSKMRLKVPDPNDDQGRTIARYCVWVARKDTEERCALEGVSRSCPQTCGTCSECTDSTLRFKFLHDGVRIARSCEWTARFNTVERCAIFGMADTCRDTCGKCRSQSPGVPPAITWTQLGSDIDGEADGDKSGHSISISSNGQKIAIGAEYNDGTDSINYYNIGHVRVYTYDDSSAWTQLGSDIDGEAVGDRSGVSVSLSADGRYVAVGAEYNDGNGCNSGHVRIYVYNDIESSWSQFGGDINGEAEYDSSGISVSLSEDGQKVAIGAKYNGGKGMSSGHTRIYEYNDIESVWYQIGGDIDGETAYDGSGGAVSLSSDGQKVAIGARNNNGNGINSGHVRIYDYDNSNSAWNQIGDDIDGEVQYDYAGSSVSLSADGKMVAVGAWHNDGNGVSSGNVRIYEYNNGRGFEWSYAWRQVGQVIDGEGSGWSTSLSADGKKVAVSARYQTGNVRVFKFKQVTSTWIQVGDDIDDEADGEDIGSISVSLSSDGEIVAVGDYGSNSGKVRVYKSSLD